MSTTTNDTKLPAAGTYALDASHSHVGFKVRHLVVGKTRGRFADVRAEVVIAPEPTGSSLVVTVQLDSVDTRDQDRDDHLRGEDFFDVANHPEMTFRSTGISPAAGDRWQVAGELTLRGITRPLTLDVIFDGSARDPWGNDRAAFSATASLNREDFGLTWNLALETGGVVVGKRVDIEIEAELVKAPA